MTPNEPSPRSLFEVLLRNDFLSFALKVFEHLAPAKRLELTIAVEAIAYAVQQIIDGRRRRQTIAVPPRSLKSILASVALPAFLLGRNPSARIICVSYNEGLAAKHSLDCRSVMKSSWYQELFPATRIDTKKDTEIYFRTTDGGFRDSTSVGGTLTGLGAELIIIDDPMKSQDAFSDGRREKIKEWYGDTLLSRLDDQATGAILILMQRLHEEDLVGHVTRNGGWHQLSLPATAEELQIVERTEGKLFVRFPGHVLDPARFPPEALKTVKDEMSARGFAAQFQQNPLPLENDLVRWSWFRFAAYEPQDCTYTQSWDFASKDTEFSSYTVCTTWARSKDHHYLVDVFRKRLSAAAMYEAVLTQARRWRVSEILIEDAAAGTYVISSMRAQRPIGMPAPIPIRPEVDKATRFYTAASVIEQGRVFLKEGAPWIKDLQTEIAQFPRGRFSDQVDSISQYLGRAERRRLNPAKAEHRGMFFND